MPHPRRAFLLTAGRLMPLAALAAAGAGNASPFSLGMASGSPLADAVVICTRILHDQLNASATPPRPSACAGKWPRTSASAS